MTDSRSSDNLDRLLCRWAKEQSPIASDLDQLTGRIVQSLDDPVQATVEPRVMSSVTDSRWHPAVWFACGAAAVLLLAFAFLWVTDPGKKEGSMVAMPTELPPPYTWLQDEQLRNKALLLSEMESIFGRQLNWLAETGDDVQVDVEDPSSAGDAQALAVRVVVERRQRGQPEWTVAWAIDVVARNEQVVRLVSDPTTDSQFAMWAYALPDGMIAVDTDFDLSHVGPVKATTSNVQADRQPLEVLKTQSNGMEFRVFQTAAVLDDRVS